MEQFDPCIAINFASRTLFCFLPLVDNDHFAFFLQPLFRSCKLPILGRPVQFL